MKKYSKRKFRVGDKIKCTKSEGYGPEKGTVYTIASFVKNSGRGVDKAYFPVLKELSSLGRTNYWDESYFEKS